MVADLTNQKLRMLMEIYHPIVKMSDAVSRSMLIGEFSDWPAPSSTSMLSKFTHMGDTLRIATPREPQAAGLAGEICWSHGDGEPAIHVCVVSAEWEDKVIKTPAVWLKAKLV
jgi:hypothetical protein